MKKPYVIFLMGPTASGKTSVAVEISEQFPVEIISVDSALVYRGMNIGTAKPDDQTLARAPHHLIDIIYPTEAYSAAAFCHDARRLIPEIIERGKIPLLVGGTMLYFKALREGLSDLPQSNPQVRASLEAEIAQYGTEHLHQKLAEVDAATADRLEKKDTQRIQRALEIYRITGYPMSYLLERKTEYQFPYHVIPIALLPSDRSQLHKRISLRFNTMLQQGLVDELRELQSKFQLHRDLPAMRCVGYRQAWQYLSGEINQDELLEMGVAATRQLAKRQITWLRSMKDNLELDCFSKNLAGQIVDIFISSTKKV